MKLSKMSEQSWVIRNDLGEFIRSLLYIDRRWVRLDSCSNNTVLPDGAKEGINCPIEAFCDLLGHSNR
jgi:hypothetical protein